MLPTVYLSPMVITNVTAHEQSLFIQYTHRTLNVSKGISVVVFMEHPNTRPTNMWYSKKLLFQ